MTMICEHPKCDIVRDFRKARSMLRLSAYDAWLAEHIAGRVARLLGKRDEEERGGGDQGDVPEAGESAVSHDSPRARTHANKQPI